MIAKRLIRAILDDGAPTAMWFEPFVGGGNVMEYAAPEFDSCMGMDAHEDLILMWQAASNGWCPGDLTRDRYRELRREAPSPERGFAGFGASFGGRWFEGYGVSPRDGELWHASRRALIRQGRVFQRHGVALARADFGDVTPPVGSVVYCDPPYVGTKKYAAGVDHDFYYETLLSWAGNGARVYASEYAVPGNIPCTMIWSCEKRSTINSANNKRTALEKLFRIGG